MARQSAPWPYDIEVDGKGYMKPPPRLMRQLGAPAYTRDSLPWFPERQQPGSITERQLPPKSEKTVTIKDRSGGFGWTETNQDEEDQIRTYAYTDAVDDGLAGDGQGVDCSVEGTTLLGPKVNTLTLDNSQIAPEMGHFELTVLGTRWLYIVLSNRMFRSSDGTTFSLVQASGANLPSTLTGRPRVFRGSQGQDQVYFPFGELVPFRTWDGNPATALGVPTTTDNNKVIDFVVVDDEMHAIWRDTATNRYRTNFFNDGIAAGSAGTTPTWNPSIAVSDISDPAQYLMMSHDTLYIGCKRFLRTLDAERETLSETLWETAFASTENFRAWADWNRELWFTGGNGTYRIMQQGGVNVFQQIGPETLPANRTPIRGVIRAMVGDDYVLHCFLRTEAGVTYLLKFRVYDEGKRHAFHSISRIGTYDVDYAFISTIAGDNPRLYFGTKATEVRYIVLAQNGFYPASDPAYEFCERGYLYETRLYGGMYFVNKVLIAFTGRGDDFSTTQRLTPAFRISSDGAFQVFGEEIIANPGTRIQMGAPVTATFWEGRIKFERGSTLTTTPKLSASTYSFALRPLSKGYFTIYLWLQDGIKTRSGARDPRSAAHMEDTLIQLDSSSSLVTLRNKRGNLYEVLVDEVKVFDVYDEADESVEAICKITASEFAARGIGTHQLLGGYTHDYLSNFTHEQLSVFIG